jgi:hypothetical protein
MKQDKPTYETYKKPSWFQKNWIALATLFIGLISVNLIFFSGSYWGDTVDPSKAGVLGDFVGGYIGTIFSLVAVMFLYLTLRDQRESSTIEKFDSKYFELIQLHRDNVKEIGIGDDFGKKIFVVMIREFREILKIADKINKKGNFNYTQEQLFVASYCGLFFGVGPNSSRMMKDSLFEFSEDFADSFISELEDEDVKQKVKQDRRFKYIPFEGHQSRLGHYYRHLYQTITYVDSKSIDIDKYEYVKTIRAQLSTHEQALLFINCLSTHGRIWNEKGLLLRYKFIKNIPPNFFDKTSEIDVTKYFPNDYFEFQE